MVEFQKIVQAQFDKMCSTGKLFRSSITGQEVWDLYLNGFEEEHNPIFRDPESSTNNCNLCKNFIRRYGNIIAVDEDYNLVSMFDVDAPEEFISSSKSISKALKESKISEVFFETFGELNKLPYESCSKNNSIFKLGVDKNVKRYTKEEAEKWLLERIEGVEPKTYSSGGSIYWCDKDDKWLFEQDFKNGWLWVFWRTVWNSLEGEFGLSRSEIVELLTKVLHNYTDNGKLKIKI